ncbi:MAG TPA: TIGR03086 family metal-binding protein [Acidimicrobiales bacterium]|nr:TIGR03086 family metal-binding protein [Acidimicrobiales bacterium]
MTEIADRYATIADGFTRRVEGASDWAAQTPCPDWSARDLVAHVIDVHRRIKSRIDGGESVDVGPDEDVIAAWSAETAQMQAVLADPERAGKVVQSMFGEAPFEELVGGLLCADTLVHTWDLARATGQDDRLDAEAVARAQEFLTPLDEPMRAPGGMGPKVEAADDADDQTKLIAFMGRHP